MYIRRGLLGCLLVLLFLTSTASAAGGYAWSDSVFTRALSSDETSLQEVLNALGYTINVDTDELGVSTFTTPSGLNRVVIELKHAGASYESPVGWYPEADTSSLTELLPALSIPGACSEFSLPDGSSFGLFIGETLFDDFWFTENGFNWDSFDHARVFQASDPNTYVVAWEDLPDGGDQDYQDMVIELRFANPDALTLAFDGQTYYLFCTEDYVCFDVNAANGTGDLTLYLIEDGTPTEVASGPSPLTYEHCFLPWPVDSIHTFDFRVEDEGVEFAQGSFSVEIKMNSRPDLFVDESFIDTLICDLDLICFDVLSATDDDGDEVEFSLVEGVGSIDPVTGEICFNPEDLDSSVYMFVVQASDSCCGSLYNPFTPTGCPRDTLWVSVHLAPQTILSTIEDATIYLCELEEICFPVSATTGGEPAPVVQDCGVGVLADGQLCFTPSAPGVYQFCFHASDFCGTVYDTVTVTIELNLPPTAYAGEDSTFHCTSGEICWPAYCSDPDNNLISCELISGPGAYSNEEICFTPPGTGSYQFVLQATDECQAVDLDTVTITVTLGNPPTAYVGDMTLALCDPEEICIPAWCSDPDDDLVSCELIGAPQGAVYADSAICFTPTSSGTYTFILRAEDACGSFDLDTGTVVLDLNVGPQVNPGGGSFVLCEPDTVCVPLNVFDPDGDHTITTTMGEVVDGPLVCLFSGTSPGNHQFLFDITAEDTCGHSSTAQYQIDLVLNMPPIIEVPTPAPDTVCSGTQLCFDVNAIDSIMGHLEFEILTGPGTINPATGEVCFSPTSSGVFDWQIAVYDSCSVGDTGNVQWHVDLYPDPDPVVLPPDGDTLLCYEIPVSEVCFDFTYDNTQLVSDITVTADPVDVPWSGGDLGNGNGQVCFTPFINLNETYQFTIELTDICGNTASAVYSYNVEYIDCDSNDCLTLAIEQTECVTLGSVVTVDIVLSEGLIPIGGYDLLITYDPTAFTLLGAQIGSAISGWEYFTYRQGPFGNCGGGCPSGLVQLVSIADINNGANHPPIDQFLPDGVIGQISFRVTSNTTFEGLVYPVKFFWWECGDNGISTVSGDTLLVDRMIFDPEQLLWDEEDDVNYPEASRYTGLGVPDSCVEGDKTNPLRCITFINGSICIIDNDSIDVRGDINLNGLAYEISDAVLFTNYFLKGITVFTISVPGQTAASDINNDGMPLTIGDLIYLIRVITGDALPIPKLSPYADNAIVSLERGAGSTAVFTHSSSDLGGLYLRIDLNGDSELDVLRAFHEDGMELKYEVHGGVMNLLVYGDERDARVPAGKVKLFDLVGDHSFEIIHAEASDYYGNMVNVELEKVSLPSGFSLTQNYPNPFNPETDIDMYLAKASDWRLTIFNINGQVVRQFEGYSNAGVVTVKWDATGQFGESVATGVYLYRMDAAGFTDTKKMLLLK